jgi:hypothetical protein
VGAAGAFQRRAPGSIPAVAPRRLSAREETQSAAPVPFHETALAGSGVRCLRSYNLRSTVSSLDSHTNSVVRMTLLGVFA